MYQTIYEQGHIIILMQYEITIKNTEKNINLLKRYFSKLEDAKENYEELLEKYKDKEHILITLFDSDKQTNIDSYDSDYQI